MTKASLAYTPRGCNVECEFHDALAAGGLSPHDGRTISADGRLHRFQAQGDKPGRRNGWAVLYMDGVPHGVAGNWRTGERIEWSPADARFTAAERNRQAEIGRERDAERKAAHQRAARKAAALWTRLPAAPADHPYLTCKRVVPGPCRLTSTGALAVPVFDATTSEMVSLQFIRADGSKRFLTGGRTAAGCCILGDIDGNEPMMIVEGYATGASIRLATDWPVVVAFMASNLKAVAEAFRARFPDRVLAIAADNDINTPGNPGVTKATEAAIAVNARLAVPPTPGDFNDYCIVQGPDAVRIIFKTATSPETKPETDGEIIARLAKLPALEYDRGREAEAKRLGVRVGTLDRMVGRERGDDAEGDSVPLFPDLETWPHPVDGAALLDDIAATFCRYVVLPEGAAEALSLWTLHAHAHDAANVSPILAALSPEKRCGKTTLLSILGALTPRPLPTANITAAVMFRAVEKWRPTLLIDELDSFLTDSEELRGVLNSGHNRLAAFVLRCVGDDHEPRRFRTWAPKAVAMIGALPGTLADRSIAVRLRRKRPDETAEPLRFDRLGALEPLARRSARWAADNMGALQAADPDVPAELHDRAADNWRPLFAVADLAGGNWSARAHTVARSLSADTDDADGPAVRLLADVRAILKDRGSDRIASADMAAALGGMEHRSWPEWSRGKPITPRQVARLLGRFGIAPSTIRTTDGTPKGYRSDQFHDAFARYLPDDPQHRHNPHESAKNMPSRSATVATDVADRKPPKLAETVACGGVADKNPLFGGQGGVEAVADEMEGGAL